MCWGGSGIFTECGTSASAQPGNTPFTEHEFHENHHSVTFYFIKKESKQCCDTTMPESIHTKDESIFGVN